jgi:hypothetical protein
MAKMTEPDRADVLAAVKRTVSERVFGINGFGDIAKTQFDKVRKSLEYRVAKDGLGLGWKAQDGSGPLEMAAFTPTGTRSLTGLKEINNALKLVDQALRVQAAVTKEPIANLRKQVIEVFQNEGSVSDAVAASLSAGLGSGAGAPLGGVKPMGSVKTEAQMRDAVADLPPVPQSELDEADRVLREALKRTDLTPAARKQIEERLAK